MIYEALCVAWVFAMGFIIGRGFPAKPADPIKPSKHDALLQDIGRYVFTSINNVWFDMSVTGVCEDGTTFLCSREATICIGDKPPVKMTFVGETAA